MNTGPRTNVLIIDADNVRRGMLACSLPTSRYSLDFTKTASEGLDRIQRSTPDVVLVGHDSSTADLCQRLRSLPAASNTLVVVMDESFRDETASSSEAETLGADLALAFPFPLEVLEDRVERHRARSRSGEVSRPAVERQPPQQPQEGATESAPESSDEGDWASFRTRVGLLYQTLDTQDYYQLLEVPRGASAAEVKESYFDRSIEFHPDRFMQLDDDDLKERLYQLFKRYTEAFKVLMDPAARREYEEQLALPPSADRQVRYLDFGRPHRTQDQPDAPTATPSGAKYLHLADLAERNGNLKSARMYLTLATQCEPRNRLLRDRLDQVTEALGREALATTKLRQGDG